MTIENQGVNALKNDRWISIILVVLLIAAAAGLLIISRGCECNT